MDLLEITDNKNRHPWEIARKIVVNKFINRIEKKNIKLLDVGSGDAYLADSFTKKNLDVHSYCVDTEYTPTLINEIEKAFKNDNLNLYSSLNDVEVDTIDIVTLLDVIEHVPRDVDFLNDIIKRAYISDNTYFIITVPAFQTLFSRHDELLRHYRRYNLQQIKKKVIQCNLKLIDSGYFFSVLIFPRLLQLFIEKAQLKKNKELGNLGTWKGGKLITAIVKNILLLDYEIGRVFKLLGINLPGLSCYIICKKK